MGILDGLGLGQGDQNGWLGAILNAMGQGAGNAAPTGAPPTFDQRFAQAPSALSTAGGSGMLPQPSAPSQMSMGGGMMLPQQPAPSFPSMSEANGFGAGADAQPPNSMLPPNAMPALGQGAPAQPAPQQQQAPDAPSITDRLGAAWMGLGHGGLTSAVQGLATGQRADPDGLLEAFLVKNGAPPDAARAIVKNPQLLPLLAPSMFSKPTIEKVHNALGGEDLFKVDANKGTQTPLTTTGGGGMPTPGGPAPLAPGVKQYNPSLVGDEYMAQFGPEVQAAAKMYLRGDQMPTGNPRMQGLLPFAKTVATKYAQDMGIPFSDEVYNAKRKMQTDLASSSNNSMGGILSNGDSAFAHLAELSSSMADLGNYSGPNVPGGGHIGEAGNWIANKILPTPKTLGQLQAIRDNALKYGQESTKLYAGTGGGEGERMHALNEVAGADTNAEVQASFLDKEKSLMLDRVRSKIAQIRDTLGDDAAQKIIAEKMPSVNAAMAKIDANIGRLRGQGAPSQSAPQPAQQQGAEIPPAAQRQVGQTYPTPRGPAIWRGSGWELAR